MLKKIYAAVITLLLFVSAKAQEPSDGVVGCRLDGSYMMAHALPPSRIASGVTPPYLFPPEAKDTCGKIIFFYEDVAIALSGGPSGGFAEGAGIGNTRRATMCAVSQYTQSVFDFSRVPNGSYLRIIVSQSYSDIRRATSGIKGQLSGGWPYFDTAHAIGDTVNGYFHDFVTSGIDPLAGPVSDSSYHGEMFMNFDSVWFTHSLYATGTERSWGQSMKVEMNNGLGDVHNCEFDLFSIGLHSLGHIMGWLCWDDIHTIMTFYTSKLQQSTWMGPDPHGIYDPFSGLMPFVKPSPPALPYRWANDRKAPENYVFDEQSRHLSVTGGQYTWFNRISPGDILHYVMEYPTITGLAKRKYLKGDLRVFTENIGYDFTPGLLTDSAVMLANSIPWSSKMSYRFNLDMDMEQMPADFTITNDIGTSLLISLTADTSLKDNNGDTVRIYPGSLVNFRGCGIGGNNHALLSVNSGGTEITYTPRPGFYGRAQFGYNAWDGKEKGAFILTTIDVEKGTNVSVAPGGNFIQNGDGEEGEQVKIKDIDEGVNNTFGYYEEYIPSRWGGHYTDGQYYPAPAVIHNSYSECGYTTPYSFGSLYQSFPWPTADSTVLLTYLVAMRGKNPAPNKGEGERYTNKKNASFLLLNDTIRNCRRYRFEFDMARMEDTTGGDKDTLYLGLTAKNMIAHPSVAHLLQRYKPQAIAGLRYDHWEHYSIPFTYCNDTPATVLYLRTAFAHMMDNLSIVELPDTMSIEVSAFADELENCHKRLYTNVPNMGCPMSYTWKKLDGTLVGTDTAVEVAASAPTSYIVTVSDGCGHTGSDTIEVAPCRCSTGDVFGTSPFTTLSGTVPTTLSPGLYYAATDLTVSGATTFNNAVLLMEPGLTINVSNTAKLTLDSTHIFTCPDTAAMWKGIVLVSGGGSSGRIEVRNNSLIEDAEIAIKAVSPLMPVSGDIISSRNSVYNRNLVGIYIDDFKSTATLTYPFTFAGNVFTARLFDSVSGYPFLWPDAVALRARGAVVNAQANDAVHQNYTKALCKNNIFSNAGISLNEIGTTVGTNYFEILIGEVSGSENTSVNLFDNQGFGIRMNNTNMSSYNNRFINISMLMEPVARGTATPYLYDASAGIFTYTSDINLRYRLRVLPNALQKPNSFHDCFKGILTINQASVEIRSSEISSSHALADMIVPGAAYTDQLYEGDGITIQGHRNLSNVVIHGNKISNMNTGAYLYLNNPEEGATMDISSNTFSNSNRDAGYRGFTWPYMLQAIEVFSNFEDRNSTLTINGNTFDSVYNAISVSRAWLTKATISNNNITLFDKTMSTIGTQQFGIKLWNCYQANVNTNDLTTPTLGILSQADYLKGIYAAYNHAATICNNNVSNIGRSFEFSQVSPQNWTTWAGNTMQNAWKGLTLGSPIFDQVVISGTNTPAGNKWLGTWSPSQQNTFATVDSRTSRLSVRTGPFSEYPSFNAGAPGFLYTPASPASILTPNTAVYDCAPVAPRLINNNSLVRAVLTDSLGVSIPPANVWMSQFDLYKLAIIDTVVLDSIPGLSSFMATAAGSRFAWLYNIEAAFRDGNIGQAQNLLANTVQAMGRVTVGNTTMVVNDINDANNVVDNYLGYYDIYLHYLDSSLTAGDTANLEALALKCPANEGAIVYQARGLLRLLTGIVGEYNDQDCAEGLFRITPDATTEGGQQAYTLFPNPNQGSFTIRQNVAEDKSVRIKVLNAIGVQVYQSLSTFKAGKLNVNTGQQAPGLYLVCIDDEKGKNTCLRFVIK